MLSSLRAELTMRGVRSKHAVDIGQNLATVGAHGICQHYRGKVRAAATESGDFAASANALKTRNYGNDTLLQKVCNRRGVYAFDPGVAIVRICADARLSTCQRTRLAAFAINSQSQQCCRLHFACGQQHVQFACGGVGGCSESKLFQAVGGVPHSRHHSDNLVRSGERY